MLPIEPLITQSFKQPYLQYTAIQKCLTLRAQAKQKKQICFVCIKLEIAPSKILWIIASSVALSTTKKATLWGLHGRRNWEGGTGGPYFGRKTLFLKGGGGFGDTTSIFICIPIGLPTKKFRPSYYYYFLWPWVRWAFITLPTKRQQFLKFL